MRNRIIFKRAKNVNQRVHLPQMPDVSRLFQRILTNRAHVHVLDRGMRQLLRVIKRGQLVQAFVRNFRDTNVRLAWIGIRLLRKAYLRQNAK